MLNVIAFGRVKGNVVFKYGPRNFHADWGKLFSALSVADFLEKFSAQYGGHLVDSAGEILANFASEPPQPDGVDDNAQKITLEMLCRALELALVDISYVQIAIERSRFLRGDAVAARTLQFNSTQGRRPGRLLASALSDMDLNGWGYIYQIVSALAQFERSSIPDGQRGLSIFFSS